jgi:peptidoglycan hydrolase-like protein with peptidoglycan-binding domain
MGDGMNGQKPDPELKAMQGKLTGLDYPTNGADGQFGGGTREAVTNFQKANGLTQTGDLDPATQQKLNGPDAVKNPNKTPAKTSRSTGYSNSTDQGDSSRQEAWPQPRLPYNAAVYGPDGSFEGVHTIQPLN